MKADEIATRLKDEAGLSLIRAMQAQGIFHSSSLAQAPAEPSGAQAILEWKPVWKDAELYFERSDFFRCKPKSMQAKHSGTTRICVLGDSIAAGFPFYPAYSPTIVLEDYLQKTLPTGMACEVIDLTLINIGPSELLRVCEAARQLEPDIFVIMAGTTWYYGLCVEPNSAAEVRAGFGQTAEAHGFPQLAADYRQNLAVRSQQMIEALLDIVHSSSGSAIIAVPSTNHDWERKSPPALLGHGRTESWFQNLALAQAALQAQDFDTAIRLADVMIDLDAQQTETPHRIKVRAYLGMGMQTEARAAASSALDIANWQNYSWGMGHLSGVVAQAMRECRLEEGDIRIDFEHILSEHTQSPFHDFRMFYDHCHMTVECIQVSMAAIASKIIEKLSHQQVSWQDLHKQGLQPTALQSGSGTFQIAHWISQFYPDIIPGDGQRRLEAMLGQLAADDKHILNVMKEVLKVKNLACPPTMNAALPMGSRVPGCASVLVSRRMNAALITGIIATLKERGDPDLDAILASVIASYMQRMEQGIDLSETYFRDCFWERTPLVLDDPNQRQGSPYYRALWPQSSFSFMADGVQALELDLIQRTQRGQQPIRVYLNDRIIAECPSSESWKRQRLQLQPSDLVYGVNRILIEWQYPLGDEHTRVAAAIRSLKLGRDADIFTIFGEVYSLRLHTEKS